MPSDPLQALRSEFPWPKSRPVLDEQATRHPGWGIPELLLKSNVSADTKLVVELGSWLGESTRFLAQNAPNATVVAIDHWEGSVEHVEEFSDMLPTLYEAFISSCWDDRGQIIPIRRNSLDGLKVVSRFGLVPDVIYIDADHGYDSVASELALCHELFPTATLIGDDYEGFPGVRRSVNHFVYKYGWGVQVAGRGWQIIRKD